MTHLKIQQKNVSEGGSVENVSGALIAALYAISKDPNLVYDSTDLKGDLQATATYQKYATELHAQYPNLNITALSWYLYFMDPQIESYWANSEYGDSIGISINSAQSVNAWPSRQSEYNTFVPYSNLRNGIYAFYGDNTITSFDELGSFINIKSIPECAFRKSSITSIDLTNIESLGSGAFTGSNLQGIINLPNLKTFAARATNIAGYNTNYQCFTNVKGITGVNLCQNLPSGLKIPSIQNEMFCGCSNLSFITGLEDVVTIYGNAFLNCSNLQNLDSTKSLLIIDHEAFKNSGLRCIDITKCSQIKSNVFQGCTDLIDLTTNDQSQMTSGEKTITLDVSTVDDGAFRDCNLANKTITLPNLNSIASNCFQNTRVMAVVAPNVTSVKQQAFQNNQSLQSVELGDVTEIGREAFASCSTLSSVKFGNNVNDLTGVKSIGLYAFRYSTQLQQNLNIEHLNLPNLKTLAFGAFIECTKIQTVDNLGSITRLEGATFRDCTNLTSVTFPNTLTYCNLNAFYNTKVTKLIVPEGALTTIFGQTPISTLKYIEIPSTTTDMGAFFYRSLEGTNSSPAVVIKATVPPTLTYDKSSEVGYTTSGAGRFLGIYVPDESLSAYMNAENAWQNESVQSKLKPISQLQTDSPECWAEYQQGLSN